ncbi:hyaluronidase A-like isoform X1 [Gigantopelta aegis]|uniref:hyaluronidase A-like isoform X1 n=1 Tax=Gigantopelta aegis TaxID=1735272 RepID=UPI001B88ADD4|nr:hyaluronidase A-like isoform X1 [Gigantopelta aegis]
MRFLLLLLCVGISSSSQNSENSDGCTAPFLIADKPFVVVWNVPSFVCRNVEFNLTEWGIVTNKDDHFYGGEITLFYNLGDWPYFYKNGSAHNGGIPQVANRKRHYEKVVSRIREVIPNKYFNGLAVIDFESWRPLFAHNFGSLFIYKQRSVDLVKSRFPSWTNKTQIWNEAAREFQNAARLFMEGTLQLSRYLRPDGKWGYYGFPRCYGVSPSHLTCHNPSTSKANDEIGWLFKTSAGLFPRIYTNPITPSKPRVEYVRQQINETLRVQAKFNELYRPIMPYSMCQANKVFFDEQDLDISIKEPADMGASGVVLWGSSSLFHLKDECHKLQTYIKTVLGPFVVKLTAFTTSCYREHCSGHGRCVRKDYEAMTQQHLRENNKIACRKPWTEYADDVRMTWSKYADAAQKAPTENTEFARTNFTSYDDLSRKDSKFVNTFEQKTDGFANRKEAPYGNYVCHCLPGWRGPLCSKPV